LETREEYQDRIELKLTELEHKIWIVKQRAEEVTGETRLEYAELFRVLYAKLEQIREKLEELAEEGEDTWQHLQARVDGALSDLNNSVGNVLSRMG